MSRLDISAFANTFGGYLVFGVNDSDKKVLGISREVADTIKDANRLLQKVNRYLDPPITGLRSKEFRITNLIVVVVLIPPSIGVTHVIARDGAFRFPSGDSKTILRQGTFYVRRSAGNHLGDSRDLDYIIERRIDQFRDSLMDKVAKVVRAPESSDVFILSKDPGDDEGKRFVIEDSPDAIAVKGMSFSIAPEGLEEEIAAWHVLSRGISESQPSPIVLWRWYRDRESTNVSESHRLTIFQFCLWNQVPSFFWIQGLKLARIRETLLNAVRNRPNNDHVMDMLVVASFLGKGVYKSVLTLLGDFKNRLAPAQQAFPAGGPSSAYASLVRPKQTNEGDFRNARLDELNAIASSVETIGKIPALPKRWNAIMLDCFLHAQLDQYR